MQNQKTENVTLNLPESLTADLEAIARRNDLDVSGQVEKWLVETVAARSLPSPRERGRPLLLNPRHDTTLAGDYRQGYLKRNRDGVFYLARVRYFYPVGPFKIYHGERFSPVEWKEIEDPETELSALREIPFHRRMISEKVLPLSKDEAAAWCESEGRTVPPRPWLGDSRDCIVGDHDSGALFQKGDTFYLEIERLYRETEGGRMLPVSTQEEIVELCAADRFRPEMIGYRYLILPPRFAAEWYRRMWLPAELVSLFTAV